MAINWDSVIEAQSKEPLKPLFALVLGPSGGGKSASFGTFGVRTLVLRTTTEHHGGLSAKTVSKKYGFDGQVVDMDFTVRNKDGELDADATLANLRSILRDPGVAKTFGAIAVDSITDLQTIIHKSEAWKQACLTDKGKHNKFAEADADLGIIESILNDYLMPLNHKGLHIALSCAAIVSSMGDQGEDLKASPNLMGFKVAESINRFFPDCFFVARVTEEDGSTAHKFLFKSNIKKDGKDAAGRVLKTTNFSPRVSGFDCDALPEMAENNFSRVIAGRQKRFEEGK